MKKILWFFSMMFLAFGAEYIIPPEYDNSINSVQSTTRVVISNTSSHFSSASKHIGGKNLRYRCVDIPKIECRASNANIITTASEFSLRESTSNKLVGIYTYDIFTEDLGDNWAICGAAIGGLMWDYASLTYNKPNLTFTYIPNKNQVIDYFFTNNSKHGGDKSFMVVEVQQVCK